MSNPKEIDDRGAPTEVANFTDHAAPPQRVGGLASLSKVAKSLRLLPHKGAGNGEWTATEWSEPMPGMDLHRLASSEREALRPHLRSKSFFGTSTNAAKTQIWIAVSIYLRVVVALRQCGTRSRTMRTCGKGRFFMSQTRKIITSVAFMRAAAVCPRFSCISLAERAVMIDAIC